MRTKDMDPPSEDGNSDSGIVVIGSASVDEGLALGPRKKRRRRRRRLIAASRSEEDMGNFSDEICLDTNDEVQCMDVGEVPTEDPLSVTTTPKKVNNLPRTVNCISQKLTLNGYTKSSGEEIVIDLEDDDDDVIEILCEEKRKNRRRTRKSKKHLKTCCNHDCCKTGQLLNAPTFVLSFYGLKKSKGKNLKVCEDCYESALVLQENLCYRILEHEPIIAAKFPCRKDMVTIQDSDSESSDDDDFVNEDILEEVENNLMDLIHEIFTKYDIAYQISESERAINGILSTLEVEYKKIDEIFRSVQKDLDETRNWFYRGFAPRIQELPPIHINDIDFPKSPSEENSTDPSPEKRSPIAGVATKKVTQLLRSFSISPHSVTGDVKDHQLVLKSHRMLQDVVAIEEVDVVKPSLPPSGPLSRPAVQIGDTLYVMKRGFFGSWALAKIIDISGTSKENFMYKARFEYRRTNGLKIVSAKQMAYPNPSPVRLPVGTRVVALFKDEWLKENYYAGIVAEPPKAVNQYRYLVFFDDGYAQYIVHDKVLLVCESSRQVWDDIHPDSKDFVRNYLEQYPERPMLKLQRGQIVKTEWNGKWWIARVVEIDGSLVKMHFDADGRTELIYRGSTRLGPLFTELESAAARKNLGTFSRHRSMGIASLKRRNMPYVEYTHTDFDETRLEESGGDVPSGKQFPSRAVAKKSTCRRPEDAHEKLEALILSSDRDLRAGKVEISEVQFKYKPKVFVPHQCGQNCIAGISYDPTLIKKYNVLVIPLVHGWQRHITKFRNNKRLIIYRSPCGRRLRNMEELHRYLRVTKSSMSVDQFDFDYWVHCFTEFQMSKGFVNIKDLSYGGENVPVPCVNTIDHSQPEFVKYSTVRLPMQGVNLNTDPDFLVCCDCTDDCQNKDLCACWQLTIRGTAYGPGGAVDPTVGYHFKRLPEAVMTGIYECNSRCKCASTCLNRVAQHPLELRLQVFKTENRGWGIRCVNDIPQGAFICIYAGRLLTEQGANECVYVEGGKNYGDEYLAELDYIEVVERLKEGYESDVIEDGEFVRPHHNQMKSTKGSDHTRSSLSDDDDDEEEGEEEDGEVARGMNQDAEDADFELEYRPDVSMQAEDSIRTRLRNRKSRNSSFDSGGKDKDSGEDFERSSLERALKKLDLDKKSSFDDTCSLVTLSDDEDDVQREPSKFAVVDAPKLDDFKPRFQSVRAFFGEDELCYIMDAKTDGNIGRYLNHSCSPNVFVQNVFVDTHDLRFPWVAFFALNYISAGTELTWDYNYDVGSVPGKVLHCYCGSGECRGRLL